MAEHPGDAEAEADRHVGADGAKRVSSNEAKQRADAKRTEDQPDETAEKADHRTGGDGRGRTHLAGRAAPGFPARAQQIDPERDERNAEHEEQRRSGYFARQQPAGRRAQHRRWRHPEEHPPVDAAGADMRDRRRQRCHCRDADVRPGSRRRARRCEDEHR